MYMGRANIDLHGEGTNGHVILVRIMCFVYYQLEIVLMACLHVWSMSPFS